MRPLRKRSFRFLSLLVVLCAPLLLAACGMNTAPQTTFVPQGSGADEVLKLFRPVFWVAVAVFVVVEGVLIYSVIRYRRKPQDGIPLQIHGNTLIEIMWTILPAVIVVGIALLTFRTQTILAQPENNPVRVNVTGHQWWWEFEYPDLGIVTANEVHLPANSAAVFQLRSADVIHSFWLPRLSGKTDAIPGHTNILSFRTFDASTDPIRGQCAEFCGGTHGQMGMWAIVEPQADFDAWVAQQKAQAQSPAGLPQSSSAPAAPAAGATVQSDVQSSAAAAAPGATSTGNQAEATTVATVEATIEADAAATPTAEPQPVSQQAQGYQLFQTKGCIGCHAIGGYPGAVSKIGPNLTHVGGRSHIVAGWLENTPENMQRWLRDPNEVKPGNVMASVIKRGTLKEDEVAALTAYLETLK